MRYIDPPKGTPIFHFGESPFKTDGLRHRIKRKNQMNTIITDQHNNRHFEGSAAEAAVELKRIQTAQENHNKGLSSLDARFDDVTYQVENDADFDRRMRRS